MFDKSFKRKLKLLVKWISLTAFIAVFLFLQAYHGKEARDSFSVFAGGLGMFIYGMNLMSSSLQRIAGSRLKSIISALTRNPLTGMFTGLFITALIQSSSATTVMTVGFVNAGLMSLHQAIGIILGANIGTTVTAQLIAFKLTDLAWPIMAIGSAMIIFSKSRANRSWGETFLGFALLFLGMKFMGDTLKVYKDHETFKQIFISLSQHRILGVFAGLLVTLVVQSSSATVGLTMSLMNTGAFGDDPYLALMAAIPIVLGDNIGTCITAIFASVGASRNARRTALAHTLFNAFGTLIFLPVLELYCRVIMQTTSDPMRQVANAHTFFNVVNGIVFLPLTGFLQYLVMLCIPKHEDEKEIVNNLDKRFLATPAIAIVQAEAHLQQAIEIISRKFAKLLEILKSSDADIDEVSSVSENIAALKRQRDDISKDLNRFLIALAQKDLSEHLNRQVTRILYLSKDLEIISSQIEKFINLMTDQAESNRKQLSEEAREELYLCLNRTMEIFNQLTSDLKLDENSAKTIRQQIYSQTMLDLAARNNLIDRIKDGKHDPLESILLLDSLRSINSMLSSLKHVCDHILFKF